MPAPQPTPDPTPAALQARVAELEAENAHFRAACGLKPSERVVGSEPSSLLIEGRSGNRVRWGMMQEEYAELNRLRAIEARVQAKLEQCKGLPVEHLLTRLLHGS